MRRICFELLAKVNLSSKNVGAILKLRDETGPISMLIPFYLRYLHLSQFFFTFLAKSLPCNMYPSFKTYLHTVSTPECFAVSEYQWISFTLLYARSECLRIIGTQKVFEHKSFIAVDISQVVFIFSVASILPLWYIIQSF